MILLALRDTKTLRLLNPDIHRITVFQKSVLVSINTDIICHVLN